MEAGQQRNLPFLILVSLLLTSSPPAAGQIRLVGSGSTRCSGRVEIYHNGSWGTVCDDNWDLKGAQVVCRQLDCGTALEESSSASFGEGTGNIWLDDVTCSGHERSLTECQHRGFGTHNCGHSEDTGVVCSVSLLLTSSPPAAGQIRLVGSGSTRCSGRVEIYHNGSWGTVCDDNWDLKGAQVVCRQLDCGTALEESSSASFGEGTGNIWLDDVTCSGHERSLTECQHAGFGKHDCKHSEDTVVVCSALSLLLISSVSVGLVLLALLVLLVVCLVHRRTRHVKQTVAFVQNQTALRGLNAYDSDEDDYVNVDEVGKLEEDTGREEEEESNDYEEPACEDNYEDEDEGFNANYVEAEQIYVCVEDSTEEDDEEEEITSEEENDYENVSLPSNEQTLEPFGEYEDIYQNL